MSEPIKLTRDGKTVEYDPYAKDAAFTWIGDPGLIAEMIDILALGGVALAMPGLWVEFGDDPVYNATAAAIAIGCDLVGGDPDMTKKLDPEEVFDADAETWVVN